MTSEPISVQAARLVDYYTEYLAPTSTEWEDEAAEILRLVAASNIVSLDAGLVFVDPAKLAGGFSESGDEVSA